MKLDLNTLIHLASPAIQAAATTAITAAAGAAFGLFNSLRHRTKQSRVEQLAWRLVGAAQQKFDLVTNEQKRAYVKMFLHKEFPRVDPDLLDAAMEAAVLGLKNAQGDSTVVSIKPEL